MGLKDILTKNSWNETHYQNKNLLEKEGLMGKLGPNMDFVNFLTQKKLNLSKDELTMELIEEYKVNKVKSSNMKIYLKNCNDKIEELCGGFLYNDTFKQKAIKYKSLDGLTNTFEKIILKHECEKGKLKIESIEMRLEELLQLDCQTLASIKKDVDTRKFKVQRDIEEYMGAEYTNQYHDKLKKQQEKDEEKRKKEELKLADKRRREEEMKRKEDLKLTEKRRARELKHRQYEAKRKHDENLSQERIKKAQEERKEKDDYYEQKKQRVINQLKDHSTAVGRSAPSQQFSSQSRIRNNQKIKRAQHKKNREDAKQRETELAYKKKLANVKNVDIEIFKKVKSNSALASTTLFLTTGLLIAEAKEEMKYVKTRLKIKNEGIEIKNPFSYHKFIDFRGFQVDKEDDYYMFYIIFSDDEMIHFRTKNELLHEKILEKINSSGLSYENV